LEEWSKLKKELSFAGRSFKGPEFDEPEASREKWLFEMAKVSELGRGLDWWW
jgi:hypothetical protein